MDPKKTCNRPQATQPSFNEAMTFQPWIRTALFRALTAMPVLQWSHDLSAMDTGGDGARMIYREWASMEP